MNCRRAPFFPVGFDRKGSYYYELHTGMRDVYLATLNPVTGQLGAAPSRATERFVGATYGADWSPDGQSLAYVRRGHVEALLELGSTVIIQSLDTGTERELSPKLTGLRGVRWFPDGRSLLALGRDLKGRRGIYRIDAHTGETAALVADALPIGLSPDGEEIFYRVAGPGEKERLVVRNLESGQTKDLYSSWYMMAAALSPDGRWLVFISAPENLSPEDRMRLFTRFQQATTAGTLRADDYVDLKIMPAAGGEPRELHGLSDSENFPWLGWTPDGRHVLFVGTQAVSEAERDGSTELRQLPVEGGEPQRLGLAMEGLRDVQFHPDGQRIAFTSGRFKVEVWVLENFLPDLEVNK